MFNRAFKSDVEDTSGRTIEARQSDCTFDLSTTQIYENKGFSCGTGEVLYRDSIATIPDETREKENNGKNGNNDDELSCGVGMFRPACLQGCMTIGYFTVFSSLAGVVTSALSSYLGSQITTLEKHFGFNSSLSGLLLSANDFGFLLVAIIVGFLTRRIHIPRALSLANFVYGVSGLVCIVPFLGTRDQLAHPTELDKEETVDDGHMKYFTQMCEFTSNTSSLVVPNATCEEELSQRTIQTTDVSATWRTIALVIIGGGMVLQGMAKSPRNPLIGTYVDDNVPKSKTSAYLGIITGFGIFGPSFAYICGGFFSRIYVTLEDTSMSFKDPRWIGAWWLGFLTFGLAGLVVAVPIFCFPRYLRGKRQTDKEATETTEEKEPELAKQNLVAKNASEFANSLRRLLTNPVFMLIILSNGVGLMAISGFYAFLPKYLESQFTLPVWKSSITLGAGNAISTFLGTVGGGLITSKLKLSPLVCLRVVLLGLTLTVPVYCLGFILGCEQPLIEMGVSTGGNTTTDQCILSCNCDSQNFFPVCGADNRNYFSPCHAGCTTLEGTHSFKDCFCTTEMNSTGDNYTDLPTTAVAGLCDSQCSYFYPYVFSLFVAAFIGTMTLMPNFVAYARSVSERDQPLALGLQSFSCTALGWFPGPVIYGRLVDTTCLIWQSNCDNAGACSLYDFNSFRLRFHGLTLILRGISIFLVAAALIYATFSKSFKFQSQKDEELYFSELKDKKSEKSDESHVVPIVEDYTDKKIDEQEEEAFNKIHEHKEKEEAVTEIVQEKEKAIKDKRKEEEKALEKMDEQKEDC